MHAQLVVPTRFQINPELDASPDHSWTAAAWAEEINLDTNASHAQLDKLLMQTTWTNALFNQPVLNFQSDSQEMPLTVEDARHATSQVKSQIKPEPDALLDQELTAIALREDLLMDTLVFNAHSVKSETQLISTNKDVLIQPTVVLETPSNLPLIESHAVDAKSADSTKFQTFKELLVLLDHLLFAVALRDNQLMDSHANNAQLVKFRLPPD